jgi:hypothetical protein
MEATMRMTTTLTLIVAVAFLPLCVAAATVEETQKVPGKLHPIIGFLDWDFDPETNGCHAFLMGASMDGGWIEGRIYECVEHPEDYQYYVCSQGGLIGEAFCTPADPGWGGAYIYAHLECSDLPQDLDRIFAISADWKPLPRLPVFENVSRSTFRDAIARAIRIVDEKYMQRDMTVFEDEPYNHHLLPLPFEVVEAIRIDLDGDGTEEVILSALVGQVTNEPYETRARFIVLVEDSNVIPLFSLDLESQLYPGLEQLSPTVLFVADANGDGNMEVVIGDGCCCDYYCTFITYSHGGITGRSFLTTKYY